MKLNIDADIVPGESLGGIKIGQDIDAVMRHLEDENVPFAASAFSNSDCSFRRLSIIDGVISLVADESGDILRIWCTGLYRGTYKSAMRPGMTVSEVVACSEKQAIVHGVLVLDGEFGVGFSVPDKYEGKFYDDVDNVNELPGDMKLEELHVMHREWWR